MANKLKHVGVLRPTVPEPEVFWGTVEEVADHMGVTRRSAENLLSGKVASTRRGHRAMTPEEQEKYYQPPRFKERKKAPRKNYSNKRNWYITFFKDWKRGKPYPQEECRRFSGNPQEFVRFVGCNVGQVYRMINWYEGCKEEKYPLKSIKGWTIARIRRYDTPPRNPINRKKYDT